MYDRVTAYPGRVRLVPVAGQPNVYDMTLADSPTVEGTPLNKANLLSDATAALFGLGVDAVPDDVLSLLSGRSKIQTGSYNGSRYSGAGEVTIEFEFQPKIVIFSAVYNYTNEKHAVIITPYVWGTSRFYTLAYNAEKSIEMCAAALQASTSGNTLTFKCKQYYDLIGSGVAADNLNELVLDATGYTYHYCAFG